MKKNTSTLRITALVLLLALMIPLILASCKKTPKPHEVWEKAVTALTTAKNISLDAEITYGKYDAKIQYAGNRDSNERSYNINVENHIYPVYTDGNKTYYIQDDLSFSVKCADDSDIMREFMEFSLTNAARLTFSKDSISEAVLETNDNGKSLVFKVTGETLKAAFAPDENLTFSEATISTVIDNEGSFKSITIKTTAVGVDFYGLPLIDGTKEAQSLSVTLKNIDFSGTKLPEAPSDKSKYPELMALAKLFPTAALSLIKNSSQVTTTADMEIDAKIIKMNVTNVEKSTTHILGGYRYTRTITEETTEILGHKEVSVTDEYIDGKECYVYYTDKEIGNRKIKFEDESGNESDDVLGIFTKDSNLEDIFKNSEISGNIMTVKISAETIKKLISDSEGLDFGTNMNAEINSIKDTTLTIIFKNGIVDTASTVLDMVVNADVSGSGTKTEANVKGDIIVKYSSPLMDYFAEAPTGYEQYPDFS